MAAGFIRWNKNELLRKFPRRTTRESITNPERKDWDLRGFAPIRILNHYHYPHDLASLAWTKSARRNEMNFFYNFIQGVQRTSAPTNFRKHTREWRSFHLEVDFQAALSIPISMTRWVSGHRASLESPYQPVNLPSMVYPGVELSQLSTKNLQHPSTQLPFFRHWRPINIVDEILFRLQSLALPTDFNTRPPPEPMSVPTGPQDSTSSTPYQSGIQVEQTPIVEPNKSYNIHMRRHLATRTSTFFLVAFLLSGC